MNNEHLRHNIRLSYRQSLVLPCEKGAQCLSSLNSYTIDPYIVMGYDESVSQSCRLERVGPVGSGVEFVPVRFSPVKV